jgi:hypothetical protein
VSTEEIEGCLANGGHGRTLLAGQPNPNPELHQISYLLGGKFDAVRPQAAGFKKALS